MRRAFFALLTFFMISLFAVTSYAHPGNTDSKGGHYNRSTGEYHYHHGYSAHQHTDMDSDGDLDCPYNFKDNADHESSSLYQNTIDQSLIDFPNFEPIETIYEYTDPENERSYKETENINNNKNGKEKSPWDGISFGNSNADKKHEFSLFDIPSIVLGSSVILLWLSQLLLFIDKNIFEIVAGFLFKVIFYTLPIFIIMLTISFLLDL